MHRPILTTMFAVCLAGSTAAVPTAQSHPRRIRHAHAPAAQAPVAPRPAANGVEGNAPFNNQLRKFSDPLGANGAK